jgi:uncharacterized protein YjbJ (UPF0337 family)
MDGSPDAPARPVGGDKNVAERQQERRKQTDQGLARWPATTSESESGPTWVCNGTFTSTWRLSPHNPRRSLMVDKDRIEGSASQAKGKVKEVAGKLTGDSKLQNEGKGDQLKGKVQNTIGGIKDTLRGK